MIFLFALFVVFTVAVKIVDVAPIGPMGSEVGFSTVNGFVAKLLPYREVFYGISEVLGYLALLICGVFALIGVMELVQRRSIALVDRRIKALGVFYVVVIGFYVLFEKLVINYRPVLEEGSLEASYPSSHTMLAVCVFLSTAMYFTARSDRPGRGQVQDWDEGSGSRWTESRRSQQRILWMVMIGLTALMVITRLCSGVHWFTDILGGILLSAALLSAFRRAVQTWG